MYKNRKILPHGIPYWVEEGAEYFITVCAKPRGVNQLCDPATSQALYRAFMFYHNRKDLWLHLLVLMPDHFHAIINFNQEPGMRKSILEFKKYTAKTIGVCWQRDFFDHRLRRDESYIEKANYIRMNPVRAGLCAHSDEWEYAWENR